MLTHVKIKKLATSQTIYNRGVEYYNGGRILNIKMKQAEKKFHATVFGKKLYNVQAEFDNNWDVKKASCTCEAFHNYNGICKHVVATLTYIRNNVIISEKERKENIKKKSIEKAYRLYENFSTNKFEDDEQKSQLQLEVELIFEKDYTREDINLYRMNVTLKMGIDRLYVVKDIKKVFEAIDNNEIYEFGKLFIFDPEVHEFNDEDKKLIAIFKEIYENDKLLDKFNYGFTNNNYLINGKCIHISESGKKRIFKLFKDKVFNITIDDENISEVKIDDQHVPINFNIKKSEDAIELELEKGKMPLLLTEDGEYIFFQDRIYLLADEQKQYIKPLLRSVEKENDSFKFYGEHKDLFATEILPKIKQTGNVKIDKSIQDSLYEVDLQAEIYFDKEEDRITAKVDFKYDDIKIQFPVREKIKRNDDKILIRDSKGENKMISILNEANFLVSKDKLIIENDDDIFQFIYYTIPKLQQVSEIYYSDEFKNMSIRDEVNVTGSVKLNSENDMLEFSFNLEGIDQGELIYILKELKEKKKYYKLKSGAFIPLEDEQLIHLGTIIEQLNISDKELQDTTINLPKYRAMYLDEQLKGGGLRYIKKNTIFKQLVQNIKESQDMDFEIPANVDEIMRGYQKTGFNWLKTLSYYGFGGILADDMGLGKTLQAIAFILSEYETYNRPTLVIAPTSLVYNWEDEINKFAEELKVGVISGTKDTRLKLLDDINDKHIVITSYALIRRDIEIYKEQNFAYCILDEAQHIKNPNSLNAKSVKMIKAKGYFALTGTPIENSLSELWSIFDFIMPNYLFSYSEFSSKYEKPIIKDQSQEALNELIKQIKPFILRRLKKDVLKELPPKIETKMTAELTNDQKKIYLAYLEKAKAEINKVIGENGFKKSHFKILSILMRLRQICCDPRLFLDDYEGANGKLELLLEVVQEAIESGHRILLFSQFTSMLVIIKEELEKRNITYKYLYGAVPVQERRKMVNEFNEGEGEVFLISLKAGGTGLNLTGADMVIHYDPWWNPAVEEQATDRAYRIGQTNTVQVIKIITHGTIEEKIFKLQERKRQIIDSVIKPGETFLTKMSEEDIKDLLDL